MKFGAHVRVSGTSLLVVRACRPEAEPRGARPEADTRVRGFWEGVLRVTAGRRRVSAGLRTRRFVAGSLRASVIMALGGNRELLDGLLGGGGVWGRQDERDRFEREVAAADRPLVVLL